MQSEKKIMSKRTQAGFTLVELMITTVISGFVVAGGVTAMMAFNKMEGDLSHERKAGQQNRRGNVVLERTLVQAGYGIDPFLAFDPHRPDCTGGVCVTNNVDAGDYPAAVGSDDLLFAARDPNYFALAQPDGVNPTVTGFAWMISTASSGSITLQDNGSSHVLPEWSVLLAVCPGGYTYTLVTTGERADILAGADKAIALKPDGYSSGDDPFHQPVPLDTAACLTSGQARAFIVNRYRFMIREENNTGRRYIFLSRSVDNSGNGSLGIEDWELVSTSVGDMQVSYIMRDGFVWGKPGAPPPNRPGGDPDTIVKNRLDDWGLLPCSAQITIPFYRNRALAPCALHSSQQRANAATDGNPIASPYPQALWGNVKAVRLTLLTRTDRPMLKRGGVVNTMIDRPDFFDTEDGSLPTAPDGRPRFRLSTVIQLPNMAGRGVPLI